MKYLMILVTTCLLLGETHVCADPVTLSMYNEVHTEYKYIDKTNEHYFKVVIEIQREPNEFLVDLFPPCQSTIMVYGDAWSTDIEFARQQAVFDALHNLTCLSVPHYAEYLVLSRYWDDPIWQLKQQHRRAK